MFFLLFSLCIFPVICFGQSTNQNYIKRTIYRGENSTNPQIQIVYYDGLGRSIQNILNGQASDGNDIITHIEYNPNGLQVKEFLPYVRPQSLDYDYNADENSYAYYNNAQFEDTTNPYVENSLEKSPMKRVLKTAHPGNEWKMGNDREIKYDYKIQTDADKVVWFSSGKELLATNVYKGGLDRIGYYHTGMLKKNIVKNENWKSTQTNKLDNTTEIFTDDNGYKVLERKYWGNEKHDTYYVYDINGNLTYVIPPIVSTATVISDHDLNFYCYQYKYDVKNRLVQKKLPAIDWEYYVYDKKDRVVLHQNGKQKGKEWNFIKYDIFDRVLYSGIFTNSSSHLVMQNAINSMNANPGNTEKRSSTSFNNNGIEIFYTKNAFPTGSLKVLKVNYYDDYTNLGADNFENYEGHVLLTGSDKRLKGLLTASFVNVLNTADWDKNYYYYDNKYLNLIQNVNKNILGGYTIVKNDIDFSKKIIKKETFHKRLLTDNEIYVVENFDYTDQDMLSEYSHKINNQDAQYTTFEYDPLLKLVKKNILGTQTAVPLQAIVPLQVIQYDYNVRNQLTGINKDSETSFFSLQLNYQKIENIQFAVPMFDGKISSVFWRTANDNIKKGEIYHYDNLSRLTNSDHLIFNYAQEFYARVEAFSEKRSYDKNGNITKLTRKGELLDLQDNKIDELTYTYNGNQLLRVSDSTGNDSGFKDGNNDTEDDYDYDNLGNLIQDLNKDINLIKYNHLNLPIEIDFASGKILYTYDANGNKIRKVVQPLNGSVQTTEYINGFQYLNNQLQFFGYSGGYLKPVLNDQNEVSFLYVYQYKDHLGNVRLSYADVNGNGQIEPADEILEENNYYPSGLRHEGYNQISNSNRSEAAEKYKFGGKEYQDDFGLNWLDFHARNYDPAIGRWVNIDPLADLTLDPYSYAYNNPINLIDPSGMGPEKLRITGGQSAEALAELQKNLGDNVTLHIDLNGDVSYTQNNEGPLSADMTEILNIIDDTTIQVNLTAENTFTTDDNALYIGGAFMGNSLNQDVLLGDTVTAEQLINPAVLSAMSTDYNNPGRDVLHELSEAYEGGILSKSNQASSPRAGQEGSVYESAHRNAIPQSGRVSEFIYDEHGNILQRGDGKSLPPTATRLQYRTDNDTTILDIE